MVRGRGAVVKRAPDGARPDPASRGAGRVTRHTDAPPAPPVAIDPGLARAGLGGRRAGAHVAVGDGLLRAAERAHVLGASAIQVFTDDPRGWTPRHEAHPEAGAFRARLAAEDVLLLVHGSYLVNLASPDPEVHARSVERVRQELVTAGALGAAVVTIHVGSHRGSGVATGVERAAEAIGRILGTGAVEGSPRLVLEVSAGQGDSLGVTIEELAAIVDAAVGHGVERSRLGVCLDTAHLWGAGYGLDDPSAIDELLARTDALMGPDALALVHLNDNRAGRGSRQDRHEHLGEGRIGEAGLGHLVRHPRLAQVPLVLETPGSAAGWDAVDMARVRTLLRGGRIATPPTTAPEVVPV